MSTKANIFSLKATAPVQDIFAAAETLGFEGESEALAITINAVAGDEDLMELDALFSTAAQAEAAGKICGLDGATIAPVPKKNWTAESQSGLSPVIAGPFYLYSSHESAQPPPSAQYPILIDAGLAFGTGHHGTTKGCLLAFDALDQRSIKSVCDFGAGSGVLAIAAALALPDLPGPIIAADNDPDAVQVCAANAKANGVGNKVKSILGSDFNSGLAKEAGPYDLIFANILAGPLRALAPTICSALAKDGALILSGILDEQADILVAAYEAQGTRLEGTISLDGWTTLTMHAA